MRNLLIKSILKLQEIEVYDDVHVQPNSTLSVLGCETQSTTSYFFC
ncbi:class III lanthipeptide [Anaerococcus prevotii]|nr:class III lanthipeptide [Streptococcus pyogenes]HER5362468.1 class III lanthipeptide [Streptococcus pyogenes]HER5376035.1 class III lanthipeptide [Streptococcus pyogenes]